MKGRVRVVLGTVYPYDESRVWGGVEAVALHLVHALARRDDLELHVVSCNRTIKRSFIEKRGSVTFHWVATGQRLYALRAVTVNAWRVRRTYGHVQPDVIHAQGFTEYAVACRSTYKLVLSVHGVEPLVKSVDLDPQYAGLVGHYRRWMVREMARRSVRYARYVISNAGGYAVSVLETLLGKQPIAYIANPIGDEFFPPLTEMPADSQTVLYVGNIIARKRAIDLVQAFGQVVRWAPEAKLHLLGPIVERPYYESMMQQVARLGLEGSVTHEPRLTQAALKQGLNTCSVVALCSSQETAPMALSVAMAMGRPVVATGVGGVPWLVEDGSSGYLVDVGDVDAIAVHLTELLKDGRKRREFGYRGREIAEELFRSDRVAEQTLQVYLALLGNRDSMRDE